MDNTFMRGDETDTHKKLRPVGGTADDRITMTCVEKRHPGHRTGSMLHHRFPNGFTELLMDETDREVSTLTDRAFRSLCVGDDAVYNDEFSYGFSPFNCHKPLVGDPHKKTKESKKQGQSQHRGNNGGKDTQQWKQQQQNMTQVSSFLKALSDTEKSREGIFKNGDVKDSNGESWDKSALRSIQKELSEFSVDYHNTLADGHFGRNDHHRHPVSDGSAKKTGRDNSKMWRDINRFPFGREEITSIPSDKVPKWYDSPLYRELAEAHRIDILNAEDSQPCLKAMAKEPSPTAERGRSSKTIEECLVQVKQEAKCVEVKAIEEPTETSEILQMCLDLPLRPDSDSKLTPDLPVKREVPQEEDRNSGVSPFSDVVESLATSTVDTGDELVSSTTVTEDGSDVPKMPSERSSSPSSASGSQSGPSKPPPVLPKSEKALLKAMKLTTRRIKKEEGGSKPSHKSSHSSRKQKAVKPSTDNPEHIQTEEKPSISARRHAEKPRQIGEKEHRHKNEERPHPNESSHNHRHTTKTNTEQAQYPQRDQSSDRWDHVRVDRSGVKTGKQVQDRIESNGRSGERLPNVVLTEREGRSGDRHHQHHPGDKPEHRDYGSDRVISNVPVYKAHVSERSSADRQFQRSQSMDRYVGDHVVRRASADMSANATEKAESRNQRVEKSIMEELQQRGRAKDRTGRGGDFAAKRSHSIDTYASEVSHPSNLSRQSSNSQQLSRQSSVEHTIVTQSIPMTQRKILQDPDSGQYFFVDMPVQVKTKTFYDPETGSYVQLPVQPPEGAIPQASTVEVLNAPVMLYHGFVPVPMTSIAHNSVVQASQMEQEEFEWRQRERSRQAYSNEGRPYLEPVYGQHDHMLGEFMGVEGLDCAS
ncbi:hypothetical protein CRUP_028250 [Coryphaenoides rupestris]|nr:hypothetical protein CRUP_028250 [Coryphaenoides rupestris]